jgi:hypothetical protein
MRKRTKDYADIASQEEQRIAEQTARAKAQLEELHTRQRKHIRAMHAKRAKRNGR